MTGAQRRSPLKAWCQRLSKPLGAKTAKIAKRESGKSVLDEDNWRSERKMKVVAFGSLAIKRFGHSLRRRGPQLIAFNSKPPRHEGGHICDQYA
jgi:hypothetical protein